MEFIREIYKDRKGHAQRDPDGGPAKRLLEAYDVGFAVKHTQVQCEHCEYEPEEN
jgi:hypothetical protein